MADQPRSSGSRLSRRVVLASGAALAALASTGAAFGEDPVVQPAPKPGPTRMPTAFVSHGSPMAALNRAFSAELHSWAQSMPAPVAVLCVSAHFQKAPITIGSTTVRPLIYDFGGFPKPLYALKYAAPGAPKLANRVRAMLASLGRVRSDPKRGHDHGTWVPLRAMYPKADVPVLSVSLPSHDPKTLWRIGRALMPLRDEGVLILGSGGMTHNLRHRTRPGQGVPDWSTEFDAWAKQIIEKGDVDALLDWQRKAPAARTSHPTVEYFVPLILALGARRTQDALTYPITGFGGGLSRRSVMLA